MLRLTDQHRPAKAGSGAGHQPGAPLHVASIDGLSCRTIFAMPEVSIGFFPDVGCTHFLNRLPPGVGLFLGLTGLSLRGGAVRACGAATHFVPSARLPALREAVLGPRGAAASDLQGLDSLLQDFAVRSQPA